MEDKDTKATENTSEENTPEENAPIKTDSNQPADDQGTIEELKTALANSQATVAAHEATIANLRNKNEKLLSLAGQAKPEAKAPEVKVRTKPEVEVDGKKYKFRFSAFAYKGTHYEASDAALDKKILAEIVAEKGQEILKQIF